MSNRRNAKCRNPEIGTSTKSFVDWEITPFQSPGYRELKCRNTSPQKCRNDESPKCETTKYQIFDLTPFRSFRYRDLELSRNIHIKDAEMPNCEITKALYGLALSHQWWSHHRRDVEKRLKRQAPFRSFRDRDLESRDASQQESLKCGNTFWCRLWSHPLVT
jgi:hypothetical protein